MRKALLFITLIAFQCPSLCQNCEPYLDLKYVETCKRIFIAKPYEVIQDNYMFIEVAEMFKDDIPTNLSFDQTKIFCNTKLFEEDQFYLIYADFNGKNLTVLDCSRTGLVDERKNDTTFLSQLPCYREQIPNNVYGSLEKIYLPVYDCNGEEYDNLAHALQNGVIRYKNPRVR